MTKKEESNFRTKITTALRPLKAFAVENQLCLPGTPDVFYDGKTQWDVAGEWRGSLPLTRYCGMIEAKRAVLPVRSSTKLATVIQPGQKPFWADAAQRGAVVHVLVQVEPRSDELPLAYLQLDPLVAVEHLDVSSFDTLRAVSRSWTQVRPGDNEALKRWIRRCVMV